MPSRSMLVTIAWTLAAIAVVSRVPPARAAVFGG